MNIDTVKFIAIGASIEVSGVTQVRVIDQHGEVLDQISNRKAIEGKHENHSVNVRYSSMKKRLEIEGALHGFLYGQNVVTTTNVFDLCMRTIREVRKNIPFEIEDCVKQRWLCGDIDLERIDIAENYRFESDEKVGSILRQIARQFVDQRCSIKKSGTSVYWIPQEGKKYCIAFYAKGPQMKNRKSIDNESLKQLVDECNGILRVELRLMRSELKKLGLNKLSSWEDGTAEAVFYKYLSRLPLLNIASGGLERHDLTNVPDRIRPALALHKLGVPLTSVYAARTVQRYRKFFRDRGVDLRCPSQREVAIPLLNVLADSRRMKVPGALARLGLLSLEKPVKRKL